MGYLRDLLNNKKTQLQNDLNDYINNYFDNLSDYTYKEQDRQDTLDFYNDLFPSMQSAIDGFFAYNDDRNKQYNAFINNWFGAKALWKFDFPETENLDAYFAFDYRDKYVNDFCSGFLNKTYNDLFGGVYETDTTTGQHTSTPDDTNFNNVVDEINNMINIELAFFITGQANYMNSTMPSVIKLQMYGDLGVAPPQRTGQNPFPNIKDYMNNSHMLEMVQEFGLSVPDPNDIPT